MLRSYSGDIEWERFIQSRGAARGQKGSQGRQQGMGTESKSSMPLTVVWQDSLESGIRNRSDGAPG